MPQRSKVSCAATVTEAPTSKGGKKGKKGGGKETKANASVSSGIKLENVQPAYGHCCQLWLLLHTCLFIFLAGIQHSQQPKRITPHLLNYLQ